jgi:hypothetical protein
VKWGSGRLLFRLPPGTAGSSSVLFAGEPKDEVDPAVLRRREMGDEATSLFAYRRGRRGPVRSICRGPGAKRDEVDPAVLRRREMERRDDCSFRLPPGTAGSSSVLFTGCRCRVCNGMKWTRASSPVVKWGVGTTALFAYRRGRRGPVRSIRRVSFHADSGPQAPDPRPPTPLVFTHHVSRLLAFGRPSGIA